jgi:hypothetical protein
MKGPELAKVVNNQNSKKLKIVFCLPTNQALTRARHATRCLTEYEHETGIL